MAAYAALVSLLNNIPKIMDHPQLSTALDNIHIQPLLEKTGFLLDFIEGNNHGGGSKEVQELERQIASAAHAAEDLIESHIVDLIHEAKGVSDRSEEPFDLHQINEDMDAIIKEATEFKERHRSGDEEQATHLSEPHTERGETAMVGLDAELNQLLDELTRDQPGRRSISIVGMGGTGKTTLAKNVYENLLIKERFHFRAWAAISQQNNAKEVLSKLVSCLGQSRGGTVDSLGESSNETVDSLGEFSDEKVNILGLQLHKALFGRRYLIVLDDIWSVTAWDEVKRFFPDNQNQSRILLTTRLSNVARDCGSSLFMMNFLDDVNSWKLFCEKAFQAEDCPSELRKVGKEIVKSCKGLALSIVVIGGLLLKSPRTLSYWEGVKQHLKSISNSKEKEERLDVLSLSYNHLPTHLKPCFLYMGVFKEDCVNSISRIIRLWVAEGFIKPIRTQILEEIAEGFIKDLIDRNLILGYRSPENRDIGSCGIHDLLRELCLKLAKQEEFFQVFDDKIEGVVHGVVDGMHLGRAKVRLPRIGSIMTSGRSKDPTKYRLLRVVDKNYSYLNVDYYGNVNMRCLAYQHSIYPRSEWKLPTYVSFIWNLQSLIIKNDHKSLIVMPTEFWKMRQLRHVKCRRLYVPGPPLSNVQDGSLMLDNLQTFNEIVNLRLCEEVCKIISNIKDLHLYYDENLKGYDDSFVESLCNLDRLHKLNSLAMEGNLNSLFPGRELEMKRTTSFPVSLKKLSLTFFIHEWDDLAIIGSLPHLEVLKLRNLLVMANKCWSPVEGQFHHLKFLEIHNCHLKRWDVEKSHFPVLEKLILMWLVFLEEIPLCIGNIPTLELIHVYQCNNSTAISAVRIKEDQLEYDGQVQVQVQVSQKDMESFNKMLEEEELTVDNIDFKIL